MKRNQQVGWFITGIIIAAVTAIFVMVLFALVNENPTGNSFTIKNTVLTSNLIANQCSKDSSSREDNKSSKKPAPVFLMQAVSRSNFNNSASETRPKAPFREKSLPIDEPLLIENFFIPVLVIRVFAMFYRLARTGPRDDLPERCVF